MLFLAIQQFDSQHELHAQPLSESGTNGKVVILNFDDNRKSQFTQVKPILDKYGFKATFYVVCNYLDNKKGYMNWTELDTLYKEGHDIGSHTMDHASLSDSSKKSLEYQIGQSKECLQEHGINAISFAYPFDRGSDNKTVVNIVSKYYELARTASSPITFLDCDGWKDKSNQTDCRTYTKNGKLNYANKYSIRGWSHDLSRRENSYDDPALYDRFIQVVNSQSDYNKNGIIKAIPIIIYHKAGDKGSSDYNTNLDLFNKEMKYLHNGNFTVLTMADLAYNVKSNYVFVKKFQRETMTAVKSTSNFTEVPLKPVSTTGSDVTERLGNFTEVPLKPVSTTEVPLKPVSTTGSDVTERLGNFTEVPLKPVSTTGSNVTEAMANPIIDAFKVLFGQQ
jgi:peptidoglycan/xylan/chitin deacetylase (PgdA/CDA1 family)